MGETLTIIGVTVGAFIGTNLDNLVLLVALYSGYKQQSRMVTAGYITGMTLIGLICFIIGEAGEAIPVAYLGMLGVVPMGMGIMALFQLFKRHQTGKVTSAGINAGPWTVFVTTFMTQLSNGTDSIITFSIFLADSSDGADYLIASTFLVMVALFALLANYSLKHRKVSDFLGHYGPYITPFILILVGIFILSNTASDMMPG